MATACRPDWPTPEQFVGYTGELGSPQWSVLLANHGLHIEILIDPDSPVGSTDAAGIKDVVLESAITTIMDFEDSVTAVDADDKVLGYRNWLGAEQGRPRRGGHQGTARRSPASSTRTAPTPPRPATAS